MHKEDTKTSMATKWEGKWDQLTGKAKEVWGDLTDDELTEAEGSYDQLVGKIKEKYGETKEKIEEKLND